MASAPTVKSAYAYEEIRARIADGRLEPGTRLRLRELGDELGLSEMPVREALRMLQRDGMVEIQDHRGATVTEISLADVLDRVSARMWLEALAVEQSVPHLSPEARAAAEAAYAALDAAVAANDSGAFSRANRDFHEALESGATTALADLIGGLWDSAWLARRQRSLFGEEPGRMERAQGEHRILLEAATAGDAASARDAMIVHREATVRTWSGLVARSTTPAHDAASADE
ncbi:MAG: GntR family transcriptional regulator [Gaiellales bacterium]